MDIKLVKLKSIKSLGKLVAQKRKELKLPQMQLAGLSDVGVRFISDLENGKATIELGKTLQVLKMLGLDLTIQQRSLANA
jgi:HTH-type transcriptional regulator / antitoxin HipB